MPRTGCPRKLFPPFQLGRPPFEAVFSFFGSPGEARLRRARRNRWLRRAGETSTNPGFGAFGARPCARLGVCTGFKNARFLRAGYSYETVMFQGAKTGTNARFRTWRAPICTRSGVCRIVLCRNSGGSKSVESLPFYASSSQPGRSTRIFWIPNLKMPEVSACMMAARARSGSATTEPAMQSTPYS